MKKLQKGRPGYILARKMRYLLWAVLEFAVVIAVFVIGYIQTGSRLNVLTVVAVVGCLPASKMLVEFVVMTPFKGIEAERYREIKEKAPLLVTAYDLLLTCSEKLMSVEAIVISEHVICGYTSNPKTDEKVVADYIKTLLESHHYEKMTVKVFHDYTAFLSRSEGLNNMASVSGEEPGRREKSMRAKILSVSM